MAAGHYITASSTTIAMAYPRPTSMLPGAPSGSSLRHPGSQPTSQQSSALSARIAAKKAELENLRQLRDLSGTLATQMQALETKVSTLKDGTEGNTPSDSAGMAADYFLAVAYVLSNWDNVLRAITLASSKSRLPPNVLIGTDFHSLKNKQADSTNRSRSTRMWICKPMLACRQHWFAFRLSHVRKLASESGRSLSHFFWAEVRG